jgi:endonuclease/exonuclease/phosphatase family metal-dependent hydrolase
LTFTADIGAGSWKFWYLQNDGYTSIATVTFTVSSPIATPIPPGVTISIGNFNVLAPSWASPSYYPTKVNQDGLLTPGSTRVGRGISYLIGALGTVDFWSFQETETTINAGLASGYGSNYNFVHFFHDDNYWANWITTNPPFARNGVSIGVNKLKYINCTYVDKALGTGNHAGIAICLNTQLSRWVRFCAVHFDSDNTTRRTAEAQALNAYLASETTHSNYIDIIAGDLNADTISGPMDTHLIQNGFTDVLRALGAATGTTPGSGNNIDHILVRDALDNWTPTNGVVHSNNLFQLYPAVSGSKGVQNSDTRIYKNFQFTGSDHFPVSAKFVVH